MNKKIFLSLYHPALLASALMDVAEKEERNDGMTIKELMSRLSTMDPDTQVYVSCGSEDRKLEPDDLKTYDFSDEQIDADGEPMIGKILTILTWS